MNKLKQSDEEMLLSAVWESSADAMRITDSNGIVIKVNTAYCTLTGFENEALIGKPFKMVYVKNEQADLLNYYLEYLSNGKITERSDKKVTFSNGRQYNIEASYSKIEMSGAKYVLAIFRDISEFMKAVEDLEENREKYRGLSEAAFESIFISENGICLEQNSTAEKSFGFTNKEAIGRYVTEWIVPEDRDMVMENMLAGFEKPYETTALRKDGTTFPCVLRGKMMRYKGRNVLVSSLRDISEWKNAEKVILESEEKYRTMVETSHDLVLMIDTEGNFTFANKRAEELTGYKISDWLGKSFVTLIQPDYLQRAQEGFLNAMQGKPDRYEVRIIDSKGDILILSLNSVPIYENEKITGMVSFCRDITEQKRTEKILQDIVDTNPVSIQVVDKEGYTLKVNAAHTRLFGSIPPSDHSVFKDTLLEQKGYKKLMMRAKKGEVVYFPDISYNAHKIYPELPDVNVWIRAIIFPIFGNDGKPEQYVLMHENITKQKQNEEKIIQQSERLNAIMNTLPDMLFVIDSEGYYRECYSTNSKKLLLPAEEIIGMNLIDVFGEEKVERHLQKVNECISSQKLTTYEYSFEFEGQFDFFEARLTPFGKDSILATVSDITERKIAETLLKESEEKFRNLAVLTPFAIMIYQDDYWIYTNPAGEAISGYSAEELYKMKFWKFVAPEYLSLVRARGKQRQSGEAAPIGYEFKIIAKDGTEKWVYLNGSIINYRGKPAGLIAIVDITKLKQIEKDLIIAKEKAEASDTLKTAFMQNISHEIRTPLNGILGIGQVITDPNLSTEDRENYNTMLKDSGYRLLNTINDYMDISLIASGNQEVFLRPVNIKNILNESYESFCQSASEKNLKISVNLPSEDDCKEITSIVSDDYLIKKVLNHLLDNAVKFTDKGEISIGYSVKNNVIEFYAKDTGVGIKKDAQGKIFNYFTQEDESISRGFEGSGLGLSIAKGIAELLGGKIWVESVKGKGSTFFFTIPIQESVFINPSSSGNNSTSLSSIDKLVPVKKPVKPIILIAEDDKLNFLLYLTLLKKLEVEILHANTGKEAVDLCVKHPDISLVIMDIKMPVMNGLEATRQIKSFRCDLPIIAITAYAMSGDEKKIFEAGCDGYIPKPFDKEELYEKLELFGIKIKNIS